MCQVFHYFGRGLITFEIYTESLINYNLSIIHPKGCMWKLGDCRMHTATWVATNDLSQQKIKENSTINYH